MVWNYCLFGDFPQNCQPAYQNQNPEALIVPQLRVSGQHLLILLLDWLLNALPAFSPVPSLPPSCARLLP